MYIKKTYLFLLCAAVIISGILIFNEILKAHCDTIDGPVVAACKKSLETGNINYCLIWVQVNDEQLIKDAFAETIEVRSLSAKAKELADMKFFETVVRVHRKGEGAPYDGLKPAGSNTDPSIAAGDKAIETGSVKDVEIMLNDALHRKLQTKFNEVIEKKNFDPNNVSAGRDYVKAYVEYIHFVESMYNTGMTDENNSHNEHKHR